ncbi:high mobility group protein [Perkinsela sp. CCAP 1560/4]|nr:high mobility group protein [Perkinsela sp. CCAP 1560/4]|eukprot:KNH06283.1 high mobility group protein [Perkinsela sp. CCAP 1560/4]
MNVANVILNALNLDVTNPLFLSKAMDVIDATPRTRIPTVSSDAGHAIQQVKESSVITASKRPLETVNIKHERADPSYQKGYALFCELKTPKEQAMHPADSHDEITLKVQNRWNKLDDLMKERFQKRALQNETAHV